MVVIIEGTDGTGKTTLCELLRTSLKCMVIHEGYPGNDQQKRFERVMELRSNIYNQDRLVIYDRCTSIDDFVYDFLNKEHSSIYKLKDYIKLMLKDAHIFHLVLEDKEEHKRRLEDRGDNYISWEQIEEIEKSYKKFYRGLKVNTIKISNNNVENLNRILDYIKEKKL